MRSVKLRLYLAAAVTLAAVAAAAPACQITVAGTRLLRCGEPFRVQGANYYPKDAAWRRFWTDYTARSAQIDTELDKARDLGINTLRIFLIFDLFADSTSPHLAELQDFLDRLEARKLKALVTLFDFYRDSEHPYCDSVEPCDYAASHQHIDAVLAAVGNHPAVLGWDLKNEMDLDYGAVGAGFTTAAVKAWGHAMAAYLGARTDRLVTLGFSGATPTNDFDPDVVAELACDVDVVSFHWFLPEAQLEEALTMLQDRLRAAACPERPILLEEFGLHTRNCTGCLDPHTETDQAAYYNAVLSLSEAAQIAGTLFWTLNDFSYIFPGAPDTEHCLGILRNGQRWAEPECDEPAQKVCSCQIVDPEDYSEKPAVDVLRGHWGDLLYLDLFNAWVDENDASTPPGWSDNFADEVSHALLGGAHLCGYSPGHDFCPTTRGLVAFTKYVAPDGTSIVGRATSPLLRDVDVGRFPLLAVRVVSYAVKDQLFGSDAILHVGIEEAGAVATTRLLTVTPQDAFPVDSTLDLRTALDPAVHHTFRIVLELEKASGENGYSASYELDSIGLFSDRIFTDGFECGDTSGWGTTVP